MKCLGNILFYKIMVCGCFLFLFAKAATAQRFDTLYVHFEYDKSFLTSEAKTGIDGFFSRTLRTGSIQSITLSGHCDSIGNHAYNDSLSMARVFSVRQYLYTKGAPDRIINDLKGWGKRLPAYENNTDENRALNRRVEIVLKSLPHKNVVSVPRETETPSSPAPSAGISKFVKDTTTKAGDQLVLKGLLFIGGRHFPLQISLPILEELLKAMQDHPTLNIEIQGHVCCAQNTDGYDSDTQTHDLSVRRARFVFDYLRVKGIDASRMRYKGFGSSQKIYPLEETEEQQTANRRVEIKILSK